MTDTINDMELRFADLLSPDQLMEGDLIKIEDEFFTIESLVSNDEGVNAVVLNDYDEPIDVFFFDDEKIELYVFVE